MMSRCKHVTPCHYAAAVSILAVCNSVKAIYSAGHDDLVAHVYSPPRQLGCNVTSPAAGTNMHEYHTTRDNTPRHTRQHAVHMRLKRMMQVPRTPPVLTVQPHFNQQRPPMHDILLRFACAQLTRKSVAGKHRYPDVGDRSSMPRTVAPSGGAPSWQCSCRVPCYTATSTTCPTPATPTS